MNSKSEPNADALYPVQQMGFFSWSVPDNLLYADHTFADLYEFPPDLLAAGIPVEAILTRIAEEDRAVMAERVHRAIMTGKHSTSRYRVVCPSGARKTLVSMGRCFQDADGVPSYYPGVVMLAAQADLGSTSVEAHCRAAILLARQERLDITERYLSSALHSLGGTVPPA